MVRVDDQSLHTFDVDRKVIDQGSDLCANDWYCHHEQSNDTYDEQAEDKKRCSSAVHSEPLEAIGERVEQVGKRKPGHERQQNLTQ